MGEKKIKIVRIVSRFNLGGPTFNATFLTRYMGEEFENVLVGGVPDTEEKDSFHILEAYDVKAKVIPELQRNPSLKQDLIAYRKIKKIIRKEQPDIVHTQASKAGFLGRIAAKACKVPVIVHTFHGHVFHSYFGKFKTELIKKIERRLAKISTGILAISRHQKEELTIEHKICSPDKIKVIQLGFDLDKMLDNKTANRKEVRSKYAIGDDTVAIAIIGRLAPIKNHTFFIQIINRLLDQTSKKVKVFIVGDGSERENVEKYVAPVNKKFPESIVFTSWILDIPKFNHGMDIICLTSKNEGTPVSLIEAMAVKLPVVSTDVGGVRDVVDNEENGFIINDEDIETYVEKLRLLVENPEKRNIFGENGYKKAMKKYHYKRLVSDCESYYKELLNKVNEK